MAEEHKDELYEEAKKFGLYVLGVLAVVLGFWYLAGMPGKEELRGIFIKPLPPLNTGESYGPTIPGGPTSTPNR